MTQAVKIREKHPILVVDDDVNMIKSIKRLFFTNQRIALLTAANVSEALEILRTKPVHILISDYLMPGAPGTELLAETRQHHPEILRILMTGHADTQVLADSINTGEIHRYLAKPFNPRTFISDIEKSLDQFERENSQRKLIEALRAKSRNVDAFRCLMKPLDNDLQVMSADAHAATRALLKIAQAFSKEHDVEKLCRLVLNTCRSMTGADAGSISLIETLPSGTEQLRIMYSFIYSRMVPFQENTLPLDENSAAGLAFISKKSISIADVRSLPADIHFTFNKVYDDTFNYRTRSIAAIPIMNSEGKILGIVQLINRKLRSTEGMEPLLLTALDFDTKVEPFSSDQVQFLEAVTGQAAITIENCQSTLVPGYTVGGTTG